MNIIFGIEMFVCGKGMCLFQVVEEFNNPG